MPPPGHPPTGHPPTGHSSTRLDRIFTERAVGLSGAGVRRRRALMPFITGGHPSLADTGRLIPAMAHAGADAIEIGFPFSDPIADGPVIAASMAEALRGGCTPEGIFELIRAVRPGTTVGLLAMVSSSIVARMGVARFVECAADAGFDGLIVPDLDIEDAGRVSAACVERELAFSMLAGPASSESRLARLAEVSSGFLYVLARVGLTGERGVLPPELPARLALLRTVTPLPLAVGFGISDAVQVQAVLEHADAAIVGSALVRRIAEAALRGDDPVSVAAAFVAELSEGRGGAACPSSAGTLSGVPEQEW